MCRVSGEPTATSAGRRRSIDFPDSTGPRKNNGRARIDLSAARIGSAVPAEMPRLDDSTLDYRYMVG